MRFLLVLFISILTYSQNYTTEELNINQIEGTLFSRANENKLVILLSGSGPINRSGNSLASYNNSLKYLAIALAEKGLDVYSFDKRTFTQGKNKNINEIMFEDFVTDAASVIDYFKNSYKKIILIGHSQGSLVGLLAHKKSQIDAFISLAGPAESIDAILYTQLAEKYPVFKDEIKNGLEKIKNGEEYTPQNILKSIFNIPTQPFLKEWMQYIPKEEFAKLKIPSLIINGTNDLQVPISEAKLLKAANKKSKLLIIKNMNHVLKDCTSKEDNIKSYNDPKREINKKIVEKIVRFIAKKT